jgi:hypothetical protein
MERAGIEPATSRLQTMNEVLDRSSGVRPGFPPPPLAGVERVDRPATGGEQEDDECEPEQKQNAMGHGAFR